MLFTYKARDKQGELIVGKLEEKNEAALISELENMGYSVVEVKARKGFAFSLNNLIERFKPFDKKEVIVFTRQLATLLRTGTGLAPSLSAVIGQVKDSRLNEMIEDIRQSVQSGSSFSEALSKYPQAFSELFISMVEVGEAGGMLDQSLDRLADLGRQEMEMTSRIKSALVYPVVLVSVAFVIVNFLLIGVLPKFVSVFRASGAALPVPTQIVMGLSWFLRNFWHILFGGIFLFIFILRKYILKNQGARLAFHAILLKMPIFGELYKKVQISRFATILSTLISSGIPLLQALVVVEKTITNIVMRRAIQKVRFSLAEGHSLVKPFEASGLFSPMVLQMLATGEKTGKLDQMLNEISAFYAPEIEATVKNMTALLEPFMLLAMGLMVAFIALSVLLPIFNLIKVFRN